jgi:hypothetical protein
MLRILKKLNSPRAVVVALALIVALDGLLLYRNHQESAKPATSSVKFDATRNLEAFDAAAPPSCYVSGVDFLGYSDALDGSSHKGTKLGGLSGLAHDANRDLYYSVSDSQVGSAPARFYTLKASLEEGRLARPRISGVTALRDPQGEPFTGTNFDGEGIAVTREGELLVASEVEPSIRRFSTDGRFLEKLTVPQKFMVAPEGYAKANASFESLALSPNGSSLFTANERPLSGTDGKGNGQDSSEEHRWVRLLRYESRGGPGSSHTRSFSTP